MELSFTYFRSDIKHNMEPYSQQQNDKEVQPQLDMNESNVIDSFKAVDFLTERFVI